MCVYRCLCCASGCVKSVCGWMVHFRRIAAEADESVNRERVGCRLLVAGVCAVSVCTVRMCV